MAKRGHLSHIRSMIVPGGVGRGRVVALTHRSTTCLNRSDGKRNAKEGVTGELGPSTDALFSGRGYTVEETIPTELGEGEIVTLPETSRSPVPLVESPGTPVTPHPSVPSVESKGHRPRYPTPMGRQPDRLYGQLTD